MPVLIQRSRKRSSEVDDGMAARAEPDPDEGSGRSAGTGCSRLIKLGEVVRREIAVGRQWSAPAVVDSPPALYECLWFRAAPPSVGTRERCVGLPRGLTTLGRTRHVTSKSALVLVRRSAPPPKSGSDSRGRSGRDQGPTESGRLGLALPDEREHCASEGAL